MTMFRHDHGMIIARSCHGGHVSATRGSVALISVKKSSKLELKLKLLAQFFNLELGKYQRREFLFFWLFPVESFLSLRSLEFERLGVNFEGSKSTIHEKVDFIFCSDNLLKDVFRTVASQIDLRDQDIKWGTSTLKRLHVNCLWRSHANGSAHRNYTRLKEWLFVPSGDQSLLVRWRHNHSNQHAVSWCYTEYGVNPYSLPICLQFDWPDCRYEWKRKLSGAN